MLFKQSPEKFWNLIASKYAASPISDRPSYEKKIHKIKSYLTPDQTVLDIGCATGTQCGDIAVSVKQVTGIDISSKLLTIAKQRMAERKLNNIEFRQTTVFDEIFRPASFDVVMAFYVVHFYEDVEAVFRRIHEILRPGGYFISETACLGESNVIMQKMIRLAGQLGFLPLINLLTTNQLEQALAATGFTVVDKTKFSKIPDAGYTFIAQKTA